MSILVYHKQIKKMQLKSNKVNIVAFIYFGLSIYILDYGGAGTERQIVLSLSFEHTRACSEY